MEMEVLMCLSLSYFERKKLGVLAQWEEVEGGIACTLLHFSIFMLTLRIIDFY